MTSTDAVAGKDKVAGAITATATTGTIAKVTALNGASALTGFATSAGATSAADAAAIQGEIDAAAALVANTIAVTGASTTAADNDLAAWQALLAEVSGTEAVAAVAKKTSTDITNRMEINVAASFEASNGITYGGKMRIRSDGGTAVFNAPQFSAKMGAMSFVCGNNSGQMYKAAVGEYDVGLTGLGFASYVAGGFDEYSSYGTSSQGVDVNYSAVGFSAGVSHSKTTKRTQAGVSYSVGALSLGASMQDGKTKAGDMSVISAGYSFEGGSIGLGYGDNNKVKKTRLGGSFDVGAATTLSAYVVDENTAAVKNVYGVGVSHDLGGATLKAGYVDNADGSVADFGIVFNF